MWTQAYARLSQYSVKTYKVAHSYIPVFFCPKQDINHIKILVTRVYGCKTKSVQYQYDPSVTYANFKNSTTHIFSHSLLLAQ